MACPPNLDFLQEGVDSAKAISFQNLRDFVLPSDLEKSAETSHVEVVELSSVSAVGNPGLTGTKEGG